MAKLHAMSPGKSPPISPAKRTLDLVVITLILPLITPIGLVIAAVILLTDGRPILFSQERMKSPDTGFSFWKFRTMRPDPEDSGVAGGDKTGRITWIGRILRRTHFDEIPQAINLIRGDVTLVGPRAPLRQYVEAFPELYAEVLKSRPGLTGLASYAFSKHEAWILRNCSSAEETDRVYRRRCVPRKARLDLIYQRNQSLCLDIWIYWITTARILHLPGGRRAKIRYRD
jgi:lipopolysaccharide/colanic/teichoic acid biosynthesis glycosyltransferase